MLGGGVLLAARGESEDVADHVDVWAPVLGLGHQRGGPELGEGHAVVV